jgi:hypothetical protein
MNGKEKPITCAPRSPLLLLLLWAFEHFAHVSSQTFTLNGASLPLFSRNRNGKHDVNFYGYV